MAIPKLTKEDIDKALAYIDENGVPFHHQSTKYVLVTEEGKQYPPKYVVAVADHLASGTEISTDGYNAVEAKNFLQGMEYQIETKQVKYTLTISADVVESTDDRFTMDDLGAGDNYKVLDVVFVRSSGEEIRRQKDKGERSISNQTMPRLALQLFEQQIVGLSVEEKEQFPVCQYKPSTPMIRGIFTSEEEFKKQVRKSLEFVTYSYDSGRKMVIYCWNLFSTIIFVRECLKRFGETGDKFVLTYREKDEKEPEGLEFDPGLTVFDWEELLKDSSVFVTSALETMKRMKDYGGEATCTQLSVKYGGTKNFYSKNSSALAQRICSAKKIAPFVRKDGSKQWWSILYTGRYASEEEDGSFVWRLRDELSEALDRIDLSGIELYAKVSSDVSDSAPDYRISYSTTLLESKNIIFRGAPGTGKSYLAKRIAADIISNGYYDHIEELIPEQREQIEFVQFHPSYDYSDFVEGLRPQLNADGSMGFTLRDGIFKRFVAKARKNFENSQKTKEVIQQEVSVRDAITDFFSEIEFGVDTFNTINSNEFLVTGVDNEHIYISIPKNPIVNKLCLNLDEIRQMLESGRKFSKIKDLNEFFGKQYATQQYSYDFALYKEIKARMSKASKTTVRVEELKKYIFIIDEINRGEISKIFGELFFAIDPGYRGKAGEISTQYANMHEGSEKFYIPENVYIIGTMNDIDRSADSFDFAMRRRFRFIEIKADSDDSLEMLASLDDSIRDEAIGRMSKLNQAIAETEDLNEHYQIGAAYFLKLKTLTFDKLWEDYLCPLLQEYVQGMGNEMEVMKKFADAYGYKTESHETEQT